MNFPFFIAKRYFFTRKNTNYVNLISWISLLAVAVGTASLILVLSVFNGFEDLILKMYNAFDPHLKIMSFEGKVFDSANAEIHSDEILNKAYVLEEKVLLKYQEKEFVATVKGVSESYKEMLNFDSLLVDGNYLDYHENNNVAIIGRGVAYYLSLSTGNIFNQLQVFSPNRSAKTLLNPKTAFKQATVLPVGVFSVHSEIDEQYLITSLAFLQDLVDREGNISAIEIMLKNPKKTEEVQKQLQSQLGDNFIVINRLQQQEFLYKILNTEKLAVILILMLIMVIATFTVIGSLTMLILDKKQDINTFRFFGVTKREIQDIFLINSMLIIIFGALIGLGIGLLLASLQQTYGLISLGSGSFVVEAFPVLIQLRDVLGIIIAVLIVGIIASWYPAKVLIKSFFKA